MYIKDLRSNFICFCRTTTNKNVRYNSITTSCSTAPLNDEFSTFFLLPFIVQHYFRLPYRCMSWKYICVCVCMWMSDVYRCVEISAGHAARKGILFLSEISKFNGKRNIIICYVHWSALDTRQWTVDTGHWHRCMRAPHVSHTRALNHTQTTKTTATIYWFFVGNGGLPNWGLIDWFSSSVNRYTLSMWSKNIFSKTVSEIYLSKSGKETHPSIVSFLVCWPPTSPQSNRHDSIYSIILDLYTHRHTQIRSFFFHFIIDTYAHIYSIRFV